MAMKIHPISKALATPTNPSKTGTALPFEGCSLHDIIRGLSVEMSMGKPSFFKLLSLSKHYRMMLVRH